MSRCARSASCVAGSATRRLAFARQRPGLRRFAMYLGVVTDARRPKCISSPSSPAALQIARAKCQVCSLRRPRGPEEPRRIRFLNARAARRVPGSESQLAIEMRTGCNMATRETAQFCSNSRTILERVSRRRTIDCSSSGHNSPGFATSRAGYHAAASILLTTGAVRRSSAWLPAPALGMSVVKDRRQKDRALSPFPKDATPIGAREFAPFTLARAGSRSQLRSLKVCI